MRMNGKRPYILQRNTAPWFLESWRSDIVDGSDIVHHLECFKSPSKMECKLPFSWLAAAGCFFHPENYFELAGRFIN